MIDLDESTRESDYWYFIIALIIIFSVNNYIFENAIYLVIQKYLFHSYLIPFDIIGFKTCTTDECIHVLMCSCKPKSRGVVVEWIRHRTVDHKVRGSSPAAALMSFGKTLIYICHTQPRLCKRVTGRN